MPDLGKNRTGRTKYGTPASATMPKPKTGAQLAKELDVLARRLDADKGKPGDAERFKLLRSQWGKQKYVPGENSREYFGKTGTYLSKAEAQHADADKQGTPGGVYGLSYKSLQTELDKNNTHSGRASRFGKPVPMPKGNNKGGLAKKTKGFKQGGLAGQGHNDMRKGGLFK